MKPQSNNWTPLSGRNVHVESFVYSARKQCNNFLINNPIQISNINNNEKHSLNELAKDNGVTIKDAERGGAIVLFNSRDYIKSCVNILLGTTNDKKVRTKTFTGETKNLINYIYAQCSSKTHYLIKRNQRSSMEFLKFTYYLM